REKLEWAWSSTYPPTSHPALTVPYPRRQVLEYGHPHTVCQLQGEVEPRYGPSPPFLVQAPHVEHLPHPGLPLPDPHRLRPPLRGIHLYPLRLVRRSDPP